MYQPLLDFFSKPLPLSGVVKNQYGMPVFARFDVQGVVKDAVTKWESHPVTGRYFFHAPHGTYVVTFSAPGYDDQTLSVTIGANGVKQDIVMRPFSVPATTTTAPKVTFLDHVWPALLRIGAVVSGARPPARVCCRSVSPFHQSASICMIVKRFVICACAA